jgi:hypothetical protein
MHVDLLARQGQLEEAQRRLDAVPELRKRNAAVYLRMAGKFASHRGEYEAAIGYWREACAKTKGLGRELLNLFIAKALLLSGKVGEGKLMVENLRFPPEADEVLTGQLLAKVMVALHERDAVPSHDELHGWASTALAYSHTGVELAAIGWGFERAGDDEMAQLLASEAKERMHYPYLATWWPALQAWLDARGSAPPA